MSSCTGDEKNCAYVRAVRSSGSLPATGQTKCYEDEDGGEMDCVTREYPGQDGFYREGCPSEGRFVDHGDGTVTDTCTALMWQKDTADVNADGEVGSEDPLFWCEALSYCEGLDFAGHADWRLPNLRELQSIVDHGRYDEAVHSALVAKLYWYWSSTTLADAPRLAWIVDFGAGSVASYEDKGRRGMVRAVRSAP